MLGPESSLYLRSHRGRLSIRQEPFSAMHVSHLTARPKTLQKAEVVFATSTVSPRAPSRRDRHSMLPSFKNKLRNKSMSRLFPLFLSYILLITINVRSLKKKPQTIYRCVSSKRNITLPHSRPFLYMYKNIKTIHNTQLFWRKWSAGRFVLNIVQQLS